MVAVEVVQAILVSQELVVQEEAVLVTTQELEQVALQILEVVAVLVDLLMQPQLAVAVVQV
jgi:hypothetical protein